MSKPAMSVMLSQDRILDAALAYLMQAPLETLSLRKLAQALGCQAMSLYHYFPSKDVLLDDLAERLLREIPLEKIAGRKRKPVDWLEQLRQIACAYRDLAKRYPNAFPLLATRRFNRQQSLAFINHLLGICQAQGLSAKQSLYYIRTMGYFINGAALADIAFIQYQKIPHPVIPNEGLSSLCAAQPFLTPKYLDAIFMQGLELILTDLTHAVAKTQGVGSPVLKPSAK